jgi:chromosome segregation ATPase
VKTLETDIVTFERRTRNLTERLSELPSEVPADSLYEQIKQNSEKVRELKNTLNALLVEEKKITTQAVDRNGLIFKVRRAIQNLEKTPADLRRGVYENLIQFAEVHATKVRLGVYAPVTSGPRNDEGVAIAGDPFVVLQFNSFDVASSMSVSNGGR